MTSRADIPDPRLLAAHDLALAALHEITPASSVGAPVGYTLEADGVVSLRFATTLAGYPGWFWTVSLARVDDDEPTVLEAELLPGEGALLAPEWVPWAVRLADYQAQQAAADAERAAEAADDADAGAAGDDEPDDEDAGAGASDDDELDDDEPDDVLDDVLDDELDDDDLDDDGDDDDLDDDGDDDLDDDGDDDDLDDEFEDDVLDDDLDDDAALHSGDLDGFDEPEAH